MLGSIFRKEIRMVKFVLTLIVAVSGLTGVCTGDISDSKALVRSGSAFVPVRPIFEWFGAEVSFNKGVINATKGRKEVQLTVGKPVATVNGKQVALSNPPFVSKGVTYVPLRFLADAFGAGVNFDAKAQTVTVQARGRSATLKVKSVVALQTGVKTSADEGKPELFSGNPIQDLNAQLPYSTEHFMINPPKDKGVYIVQLNIPLNSSVNIHQETQDKEYRARVSKYKKEALSFITSFRVDLKKVTIKFDY